MRICPYCGAPIPDDSRFCPKCGVSVAEFTPPTAPEPPVYAPAAEDASAALIPTASAPERDAAPDPADSRALRELRMHLHQESKAWRFFAIGMLVFMMGYVLYLVLLSGAGLRLIEADDDPAFNAVFMSFFGVFGSLSALLFLPVVIMGFVMGSKVHRYWEESAVDCTNALLHAGSVGVIVLAGFFSTPALIFVIINFVKTKRNRAELEAVQARQKATKPEAQPLPRHG